MTIILIELLAALGFDLRTVGPSEKGPVCAIATRRIGEKVAGLLRDRIVNSVDERGTVELSLKGIEGITGSALQAIFGMLLAQDSGLPSYGLVVSNSEPEVREALEDYLEKRRTRHRLPGTMVLEKVGGSTTLLNAPAHIQHTFSEIMKLGPQSFSSSVLAGALGGVPVPSVNNHLAEMVAGRALLRNSGTIKGGGREFVYALPDLSAKAKEMVPA